MRSVIVYTRVSTKGQNESGFGTDAQLVEITTYAKERGLSIKKKFRETATAMGEQDTGARPELDKAMALALERSWPIIVADYSRLSRNKNNVVDWVIDSRIDIISVELGEQAANASIIARAARNQFEGEEISRRTRKALRAKKLAGELGNKTNFPIAQRKGSAANGKIAKQRLGEFAAALDRVDPHRELTAEKIANALNDAGFKPAKSLKWTPVNIGRVLGNLKASIAHDARVREILASSPSMFGADGNFTAEGVERWNDAVSKKNVEPILLAKLNNIPLSRSLTDARRRWIENWVADREASY
jgi:DNA invertase Pin-like site-specific DNA recombinase